MTPRLVRVLAMAATMVSAATAAAAQPSFATLPRIAVDAPLDAPPADVDAAASPVPVLVRIAADPVADAAGLDTRFAAVDRNASVWLAVSAPDSESAAAGWRAAIERILDAHAARIAILEIDVTTADNPAAAFAIRAAATDARARRESIRIAVGGAAAAASPDGLYTTDLAPYLDLLVLPPGQETGAAAALLRERDPDAGIAVAVETLPVDRENALRTLLLSEIRSLGTPVLLHAWRSSPALAPALSGLRALAPLMSAEITALDPGVAGFALARDGADVTAAVPHRLLFDSRSFGTFLAYWGDAAGGPVDVTLRLPVEGTPIVRRLTDGARLDVTEYSRDAATGIARALLPAPDGPMLVSFSEGAADVFGETSGVAAERLLTVDEIVARHQRQQRAQDAAVGSYIANARMEQHFRPSMTDPGYDVVTDNRYYVRGGEIEWEELSFSVNGTKWGPDRPAFPLLQPEKVLSLPLQLRFGSDYTYRLQGTARVGDTDCYVLRFEPVEQHGTSLYRGTLWVDRRTFARVKVQAVQTGLTGPVVSNEEIQTYSPVATIGNEPVFLFSGLTARQIVMIAGRNLLVEKRVAFDGFRVNPEDFEAERLEARRGDRIMYRETDRGLRYFVRQGGERVVSDRATKTARALAMGVTIDPSYAFPLPMLGLNYLNFEFRNPDTQLAVLFAGVLAAGNIQRPKLGRTPFDASVDFFAIAVPSSDRLFDAAGERESERLLTWPLTTGANVGWQYTPFQKVTAQYQFRFDGFTRDTTTAEDYRAPASTVTNGIGGQWEYRRGGYSFVANGAWFARAGWRDWGTPEAPESSAPAYAKYAVSLTRDFHLDAFQKIHVNGAWFGGHDLDRFGKYQFGMFDDTRIHGVPASGVRFGELGALRGSYSFDIFEQYRVDLFLEQAWGRDRAFDSAWQPITGIGAAFNLRAPWRTMLRVDAGKSFLPDRYRGAGSATLQVMLLKPLS